MQSSLVVKIMIVAAAAILVSCSKSELATSGDSAMSTSAVATTKGATTKGATTKVATAELVTASLVTAVNNSPAIVAGSGAAAIQVFKSPSCQCCSRWVDHIESAGFSADVDSTQDMNAIKSKFNIAPRYQSCHTAVAQGYVFEGHIPAHIVQQFLAEKHVDTIGLAVPGMPMGSPGMEMGSRIDDYNILLLKDDGSSEVYARVNAVH